MNKLFRIFGIAVMIAVIGFSFTACGGGGGGDGATYEGGGIEISSSAYGTALTSLGGTFKTDYADPDDLINASEADALKMYNAFKAASGGQYEEDTGLSLSDMQAYLDKYNTPPSLKTALIQKADSQGFALGGFGSGTYYIAGCRRL